MKPNNGFRNGISLDNIVHRTGADASIFQTFTKDAKRRKAAKAARKARKKNS